mgnify:CR=1 FL=1
MSFSFYVCMNVCMNVCKEEKEEEDDMHFMGFSFIREAEGLPCQDQVGVCMSVCVWIT